MARDDSNDAFAILRREPDSLSDMELQHGHMRTRLAHEPKSLHDSVVEIVKLGLAQRINVDIHTLATNSWVLQPLGRTARRCSATANHQAGSHRGFADEHPLGKSSTNPTSSSASQCQRPQVNSVVLVASTRATR